jgi:uncharacterized protein YdhG (YjbR/CyaY superfamily)
MTAKEDRPVTVTEPASAAAQIDAMLAGLPAAQHAALEALRATIAAAAPEAEEAISYGMPAFRYRGRGLVWYSAFKAHCSLFPGGQMLELLRDELTEFADAKGTLRFTPEHPIPAELVTRIVRERMAQVEARNAARPRRR